MLFLFLVTTTTIHKQEASSFFMKICLEKIAVLKRLNFK
jgi:hypothetical protein